MAYDPISMSWVSTNGDRIHEWQIAARVGNEIKMPAPLSINGVAPLAGHAGYCAKVTTATIKGTTDAQCSCGAEQ